MEQQQPEKELIELEHSIGYCGRHKNTLLYHPTDPNQIIYNNGGLVVLEDI